jgi:hypothetical protein
MRSTIRSGSRILVFFVIASTSYACATSGGDSPPNGAAGNVLGGSGGSDNTGGAILSGTGGNQPLSQCAADGCTDFPATPIFEDGLAQTTADTFKQPATGAAPCIVEPQDGSLYPNGWTRPRIRMIGSAQTYQITFHAANQKNDLVVYTKHGPWIMPRDLWTALAGHTQGEPIEITLRATNGGAPGEAKTTIQVAPVDAGGALVYWASTTYLPGLTSSTLYGFHPGDDAVALTLNAGMVKGPILDDSPANLKRACPQGTCTEAVPAGQVRCVGCHASTPDGHAVTVTDHWPWNVKVASIDPETVGQQPAWVTPMGAALAQLAWQGITTFSAGDGFPTDPGGTGKRRYVSSFGYRGAIPYVKGQPWTAQTLWNGQTLNQTNKDDLIWIDLQAQPAAGDTAPTIPPDNAALDAMRAAMMDLEGTGWGILQRTGDTRGAIAPKWSHDGKTVAYTSTDKTSDGRIGAATQCDIYTVPFGDGKGGTAAPVAGASDPAAGEYYPDFSADDKYLAYNRVATLDGKDLYNRTDGEIFVVPAGGGTALRLKANDPPACTGEKSPGVLNSWPKWSPLAKQDAQGKTYYFLVFSSARQTWGNIDNKYSNDPRASQLNIAALVADATGKLTDYPAIYLWNQGYLVSGAATDGGPASVTELKTSNVTPAWNDFVIPPQPPADIR